MVLSWFSKEGKRVTVVGFVHRAFGAAMGCFFACFRYKDSQIVSAPEAVVCRNKKALSSLFLSDDELIRKTEEGRTPLSEDDLDFRELKDEAKFLKACGTLPRTPVEIRKASKNWEDIPAENEQQKSSDFNSWLSNSSIGKLNLDKIFEESPKPVKICEESVTGAGSSEDTSSSCLTDRHDTRRGSIGSIQGGDTEMVITPANVSDSETYSATSSVLVFPPSVQCKNKSVYFESELDGSAFSSKGSSSEGSSQSSKQFGSAGSRSMSKPSPYPTPLKLTGEMQTPGTVFPAYMNNMNVGKPARIRSQYVYSIPNPVENPLEWEESKDGISNSDHLTESLSLNNQATLTSTKPDRAINNLSVGNWMLNEATADNEPLSSIPDEKIHHGRTPGDRPILGMVAAHWYDNGVSHISPTMWDGNGIPNSTNKYKEDQKVRWHATPFEERLEKALSEETSISPRKPFSGTEPIDFNETEETNTALSCLQSSSHFESVVSF